VEEMIVSFTSENKMSGLLSWENKIREEWSGDLGRIK
jgi:hypothetical protein